MNQLKLGVSLKVVCLVAVFMYKYFITSVIILRDAVCCVNIQAGEAFGVLILAKLGSFCEDIYIYIYLLTYLLTYLFTYLLTPWCRFLLEKLNGLQLVKKFLAFHGTRRFITALTGVRHPSLSWTSPIQSI